MPMSSILLPQKCSAQQAHAVPFCSAAMFPGKKYLTDPNIMREQYCTGNKRQADVGRVAKDGARSTQCGSNI